MDVLLQPFQSDCERPILHCRSRQEFGSETYATSAAHSRAFALSMLVTKATSAGVAIALELCLTRGCAREDPDVLSLHVGEFSKIVEQAAGLSVGDVRSS